MASVLMGCSQKNDKSQTDASQAEAVEHESDDEKAGDEEKAPKDEFLTQDLATFELRGEVIAAKYTSEHMEPYLVLFNENGTLKAIYTFDVEGNVDKGIVDRDAKKRIERIGYATTEPWVTLYEYEPGSMLLRSTTDTNQTGNFVSTTYVRDEEGNVTDVKVEEEVHFRSVEQPKTKIAYSDDDAHGNWTRCTTTDGDSRSVIKRTIIYKGEKNIFEAELKEALEGNPAIRSFIKDMYDNDRYSDEQFLQTHCTPEMLQFLRDHYEYDGEGYAFWLFRTTAQDGKPNAETEGSRVLNIFKDNEGWYHYRFLDQGWKGENRIRAYVEDGRVMVEELERVYDEPSLSY